MVTSAIVLKAGKDHSVNLMLTSVRVDHVLMPILVKIWSVIMSVTAN